MADMSQEIKPFTVLGVPIDAPPFGQVMSRIETAVRNRQKLHIITANPEIVMRAHDDPEFMEVFQSAELKVIDGVGLQMAAALRLGKKPEKVTGIELSELILGLSKINNWRVFLLGSSRETIALCAEKLQIWNPAPKVVGFHHGYLTDDRTRNEALDAVRAARPDIVLVGMGSPLQEKWIAEHKKDLPASVYIGVGGVFDVLSGQVKRAPLAYQKMGLEWLYRLMKQPERRGRSLVLPRFAVLALLHWKK